MGIELKEQQGKKDPSKTYLQGKLVLKDNETVTFKVMYIRDNTWEGSFGTICQDSVTVFCPSVDKENTFYMSIPKGTGMESGNWYKLTKNPKGYNSKYVVTGANAEMGDVTTPEDKKVTPSSSSILSIIKPPVQNTITPTTEELTILEIIRANEQFIVNVKQNLPWFHEWFKQNNIEISVDRLRLLAELL